MFQWRRINFFFVFFTETISLPGARDRRLHNYDQKDQFYHFPGDGFRPKNDGIRLIDPIGTELNRKVNLRYLIRDESKRLHLLQN